MSIDETLREETPAEGAPLLWSLLCVSCPQRPDAPTARTVELREGAILRVGRSPRPTGEPMLAIDDPRMSRDHFALWMRAGRAVLVDSSTNGTFVDGARVGELMVADGSVIRAGDSFFVLRARDATIGDADVPELIGAAPSMRRLRQSIALVARSEASVLVLGESGTGKELVARAIHAASGRGGPFVALNCAAIPESLAESQLFGHVAGAFTGARTAHDGAFRRAHGGTLLLDEIAEAPLTVQARLLRVLEERTVLPVGASREIAVDVRLVASTNVDLLGCVVRGSFRGDLHARLADLTLRTPPLCERREDILPIARHALGAAAAPLAPDLIDWMLTYAWPFNVRELVKVAAELRLRGQGAPRLTRSMLDERLRAPSLPPPASAGVTIDRIVGRSAGATTLPPVGAAPVDDEPSGTFTLAGPLARDRLAELVDATSGNLSEIARRLGRSRRTVRRYLDQHGLMPRDD